MTHEPTPQTNLKQIRAVNVLLLSIVTIGIYPFVWLVRRYNELDEPAPKVPHWKGLVGAVVAMIFATFAVMMYAFSIDDAHQAAVIYVAATTGLSVAVSIFIVWWSSRYALTINRAIETPISTFGVVVLALFFNVILVTLTQYAINRNQSVRDTLGPLFAKIVLVIGVLGVASTIAAYVINPLSNDVAQFEADHREIRSELQRAIDQ